LAHALSLGGALAVLWLLLSGYWHSVLLLSLGAASVCLAVLVARRMDIIDREGHPIHLGWRAVTYWLWLLKEIAKAARDVSKIIIQREMPIAPSVFKVKATQKSELGQVIYANSITLTPGTVTLEVADGYLTVHAIDRPCREGLESGDMDRRVTYMAGELAAEEEKA
jgi:multicomponent Na+:H+ antiporter subunit E